MKRKLVVVAALVLICRTGDAEFLLSDWTPDSVSMRVGYSAVRVEQGFTKFEMLADWRLPLGSESERGWYHRWLMEVTAGGLARDERFGLVTTLGPLVKLGHNEWPAFVTVGIKGTLLGRNQYGGIDFGESFQFTSHAGIGVEVRKRLVLEYRLEHMSNAGFSHSNPGLNLHTLALSFRF